MVKIATPKADALRKMREDRYAENHPPFPRSRATIKAEVDKVAAEIAAIPVARRPKVKRK